MRPEPAQVLTTLALSSLLKVAPEVPSAYGQQIVGLSGAIELYLAQEWDRMPARLVDENAAVAALLGQALTVLGGAHPLAAALAGAPGALAYPDYRVSTLQAANDRLRALLVDAHAAVEQAPGDAARDLDEAIWAELAESTRRRHVELPT